MRVNKPRTELQKKHQEIIVPVKNAGTLSGEIKVESSNLKMVIKKTNGR